MEIIEGGPEYLLRPGVVDECGEVSADLLLHTTHIMHCLICISVTIIVNVVDIMCLRKWRVFFSLCNCHWYAAVVS